MRKKVIRKLRKGPKYLKRNYLKLTAAREPKIFCIGKNKTGTTSFKAAMEEMGYLVGRQRNAEILAPYYHKGNFKPIVDYCHSARVFQDAPFSWPETYAHMYNAFPDASFILTVRSSAEVWYESLINYTIKKHGKLPKLEDLKHSRYVWKGWRYNNEVALRGGKVDGPIWNKEDRIKRYHQHNAQVRKFFKDKQDQFLEINVAENGAYRKLCSFLGRTPKRNSFPWKNRSR